MNIEIEKFLKGAFPDINIVKMFEDLDNCVAIYFDGFDGELNSSIRKTIIRSLKTQLDKKFPEFYFHVAHVIHGLI